MISAVLAAIDSPAERSLAEQLYINYEQKMFRVAMSILKNESDAEDAVQEAFLRVMKNLDKITDAECNETYFYLVIIVRNVAIDMYNRKRRHPEYDIDECSGIEADTSVEEEALANIGSEHIRAALDRLPDKYFDILYLYLFKEYQPADIAVLLGISPELVRQRVFRGRKQLIRLLEEEYPCSGRKSQKK